MRRESDFCITPARVRGAVLATALVLATLAVQAEQVDISGPPGSETFGATVLALPNGNFVVVDPDGGPVSGAGAVYLYSQDGVLISALTGASFDDHIGGVGGNGVIKRGVVIVGNSNFLVISSDWDNGDLVDAGAVTWVDGDKGLNGVVSTENSLVGSAANDQIGRDLLGNFMVTVLSNGNYVVGSPNWNNVDTINAGAATWGSGTKGIAGSVSASNSLVGSNQGDMIAASGITALTNGNYVVASRLWTGGVVWNWSLGAVTWGDGLLGITGAVSNENSLVGASASDSVGAGGVTPLSNGNYVVSSPYWRNGAEENAGAVTLGDGFSGTVGVVSPNNSLVGSTVDDYVGVVTPLANGNYVVATLRWDTASVRDAGAVTWADGSGGTVGPVSASNSLTGSSTDDRVGFRSVTALSNGNYVVTSSRWDRDDVTDAGAVTWGDGLVGVAGPVSVANSLTGSTAYDQIGSSGVTALLNGNYVVASSSWDSNVIANAGATTWGDGSVGTIDVVSTENSLIGASEYDLAGVRVTPLSDGNYVVAAPEWDSGTVTNVGAVSWRSGAMPSSGVVSANNSLVGSTEIDVVGYGGVSAIESGGYVVSSGVWDSDVAQDVGAVIWCRAGGTTMGPITADKALLGSTAYDKLGVSSDYSFGPSHEVVQDGHFVLKSGYWDNGETANVGAITLASGWFRLTGTIAPWNSVIGGIANGGYSMVYDYDPTRHRLIVGRPAENMVSLFTMDQIFADGLEP